MGNVIGSVDKTYVCVVQNVCELDGVTLSSVQTEQVFGDSF
jgi:hypothetical protein